MKALSSLQLIPFLWLRLSPATQAQFYAPDTEYHDCVQRVFVVEAARVLAWWMDRRGTNLAEVSYQVTTRGDQSTIWELRWLDAAGKPLKTATVSYAADMLKSGPEFYRSVFKQLWMSGWKNAPAMVPSETIDRFWRGAAKAGVSREQSLRAALDGLHKTATAPDQEWVPEMAGLLTHATLPSIADRVSLDSVLLARGAAWLAMAEQATSDQLDALWVPVLFQAGRERAAAQIWQKKFASKLAKATAQQAGWDIWMRKPKSREIFLFATDSTNLAMAMAMLAYDVKVNQTGRLLAELIGELVGSEMELPRLHNYGPLFASHTSISGGHILNGAWPFFNRAEWVQLLTQYSPSALDYRGYLEPLGAVTNTLSATARLDEDIDSSIAGLRECTPVLRLGPREGLGALIPTGVATARDLLNYGWEMTGLQMGRRYYFVRRRWSVPDRAEPIVKIVTGELEGLVPLFLSSKEANVANYRDSVSRLELLDGYFPGAETEGADDPQAAKLNQATLFVRRSWLRPGNVYAQVRWLSTLRAGSEVTALIEEVQQEGGALAASAALRYLDGLKRDRLRQIPRADDLKYALAETLPEPTELYVRSVYDRKFRGMDHFGRAQEMERLYWQNPDSGLEERVFENYLVSGSFQSAKRFYAQVRENLVDPVGFSNGMGKTAYILGFCLGDDALRKIALEDSSSGSHSDMMMHIWDAAVRNQSKVLEESVKEIVDRYEQEKDWLRTAASQICIIMSE